VKTQRFFLLVGYGRKKTQRFFLLAGCERKKHRAFFPPISGAEIQRIFLLWRFKVVELFYKYTQSASFCNTIKPYFPTKKRGERKKCEKRRKERGNCRKAEKAEGGEIC
jgi:hypothetical protein